MFCLSSKLQIQFSQCFLVWFSFQSCDHFHRLPLFKMFGFLWTLLKVWVPELHVIFKVGPIHNTAYKNSPSLGPHYCFIFSLEEIIIQYPFFPTWSPQARCLIPVHSISCHNWMSLLFVSISVIFKHISLTSQDNVEFCFIFQILAMPSSFVSTAILISIPSSSSPTCCCSS